MKHETHVRPDSSQQLSFLDLFCVFMLKTQPNFFIWVTILTPICKNMKHDQQHSYPNMQTNMIKKTIIFAYRHKRIRKGYQTN